MSVELKQRPPEERSSAPPLPTETSSTPTNRKGMLDLWSLRHLIGVMVRRDLLGQYKGSVMGFFWTIINPLGHLLLYTFVFSVILKVRFGQDASTGNFALYLMTGLLPWGALAESLSRSTSSITEQPNLVKRVVFPLEILPLAVVVSSMISEVIGLAILSCVAWIMGYHPHASLGFLPLIMLSQFMFIAGLSWLLSSLGVYLRDLRHVMSLALSVWMYASPIVYPASKVPQNLQFLLWINPMAGIVTDFRRVLLEGTTPNWPLFAAYTAVAAALWFFGYYFFNKTKRSFADVI
jgi:lipopolysaccharide transport system permease protein